MIGGALVVSEGLLRQLRDAQGAEPDLFARDTKRSELLAMDAVLAAERRLGYEPRDVSAAKVGYDIESRVPNTGRLRFIEVKGRVQGADNVTVSKNEILTALNKPDDWILALVQVPVALASSEDDAVPISASVAGDCSVRYVHRPFGREPDFGVTSVNYRLRELWDRGEAPA